MLTAKLREHPTFYVFGKLAQPRSPGGIRAKKPEYVRILY